MGERFVSDDLAIIQPGALHIREWVMANFVFYTWKLDPRPPFDLTVPAAYTLKITGHEFTANWFGAKLLDRRVRARIQNVGSTPCVYSTSIGFFNLPWSVLGEGVLKPGETKSHSWLHAQFNCVYKVRANLAPVLPAPQKQFELKVHISDIEYIRVHAPGNPAIPKGPRVRVFVTNTGTMPTWYQLTIGAHCYPPLPFPTDFGPDDSGPTSAGQRPCSLKLNVPGGTIMQEGPVQDIDFIEVDQGWFGGPNTVTTHFAPTGQVEIWEKNGDKLPLGFFFCNIGLARDFNEFTFFIVEPSITPRVGAREFQWNNPQPGKYYQFSVYPKLASSTLAGGLDQVKTDVLDVIQVNHGFRTIIAGPSESPHRQWVGFLTGRRYSVPINQGGPIGDVPAFAVRLGWLV